MSKSHEHHLGHTCGCLPVRYTVTLYAVLILILSLAAALSLATEDTRVLVGGYSLGLRYLVSVLGCIGAFMSVGAIIGIHDNSASWVRPFVYWALFRAVVVLVFFAIDWQLLKICDRFTLAGGKFTSIDGGRYNPAIETVALADSCSQARSTHAVWTVADVLITLYGAYTTLWWCHAVDVAPTYPITLDETRPLRIFTGYADVGYQNRPPADNINEAQNGYAAYSA
mmetsp:Transcript_114001/g.355008  ORF Transcript_114001/g.355008 Transcript_114001/m.355008 type:complete len:226 (+) Transcript_114001:148-825(+)